MVRRVRYAHILALSAIFFSSFGLAQENKGIGLEILSAPETVISWAKDKCEDIDIPDTGLRAYRRYDSKIIGIASHYVNRSLIGSRADRFQKNGCDVLFKSSHSADPKLFDDETWLASTWTDDGKNIAAIGHSEFHGEKHPGMCNGKTPRECRYVTLTLFASNDGGLKFQRSDLRPIAAAPVRQSIDQGKDLGVQQPSNIFQHEGMKYVFVRAIGGGAQSPATCLMRAKTPLDPNSWEVFDGKEFRRSMFDPYRDRIETATTCAQISLLNGMVWSVVRHRSRGLFIALLTVIDPSTKGLRLATATSTDLLNWTKPSPVDGIDIQKTQTCSNDPIYIYPSLIDPDSPDRNFDTTGDEAVLFLTAVHRTNCKMSLDRDLVSVRVRFVPK